MKRILSVALLGLALAGCSKKESDSPGAPVVPVVPVEPVKPPTPPPVDNPVQIITSPAGLKYYTGLIHKDKEYQGLGEEHMTLNDCDDLPKEFDLRTLGLVAPVRDQGSCGSCWSFSLTGSLESAMLGIGKSLDLSEQEIVSCDKSNYGCSGGNLNNFEYQISHGQGLESSFPYTASDSRCKSIPVAAKGASFTYVGAPNRQPTDKELMCALFKNKTVPWITVGATNAWGSPPSSERTAYNKCGAASTNHAVGVVGWWTSSAGKVNFIMKNSWGEDWGDGGYMSLPLGCNSFGEEVAFISVAQPPVPPGPSPTPTPPGPDPCVPPNIKLPALVVAQPGVEVMLGVKETPGWDFAWWDGPVQVGTGSMLYVTPTKDTVYKLVASKPCGKAESSVKVSLLVTRRPGN